MIKEINSKSNPKIKYVTSLQNSKYRKEYKQFLAEGKKSLDMAIDAKIVSEIFSLKELDNIPSDIPQYIVSEEVMEKISSTKSPEGIVFVCNINENPTYKSEKVVYLDHLNDPGNAGTIIRTALAFGYDAVVFSNDSVDIYNEKVIAATKGAIFMIPVLKKDIKEIMDNHQIIVSALCDESVPLDDAKARKPFILVLGNESHGVSKEVMELSNLVVKIPMHIMDSLNVSTAGSILMYHFR